MKPTPLRSPTGLLESEGERALASKAPLVCTENDAAIKKFEGDLDKHAALGKLTEDQPRELRAQLATEVPETSLPSLADLESNDAAKRTRAREALKSSKDKTLEALANRNTDRATEIRATLASRLQTLSGARCDEVVCGERVLTACRTHKPFRAQTESGKGATTVSAAAGVSWLEGVAAPALAQFLADRAEAELTLWLVTTFQTDLCKPENNVAGWFPSTCTVVGGLKAQGDQIPGTLLASALRKDLESLPLRAVKKSIQLDDSAIETLVTVMLEIREGQSPLAVLAGMSEHKPLKDACTASTASFSCALLAIGRAVALTGDAVSGEARFDERLPSLADNLVQYVKTLCPTGQCDGLEIDAPRARALLQAAYALASKLREYSGTNAKDRPALQKAAEVTSLTIELIDAAAATSKDASLIDRWKRTRRPLRIAAMMMRGEYVDGSRELLVFVQDEKLEVPEPLLRYAPFVVDMAAAKDAAQAKAALSAAAAPVGSWRVKRRGSFTISVTGLVGGNYGYELPTNPAGRDGTMAGGVMAALGLDFAFPVNSWTLGPYVSLVDVGQLVTAPVAANSADHNGVRSTPEPSAEVKIVQVLSPGLYFRAGAGNSPFTFGFGATVAPQLRKYVDENLSSGGRSDTTLTMVRLHAFVAVDITLFPF